MFWDAPGQATADLVQGLYGYNVPAQIVLGVVNRPKCMLVPSLPLRPMCRQESENSMAAEKNGHAPIPPLVTFMNCCL